MLAALGFGTIAVLLLLTMTKRASVLVALILLPVPTALIGGFAGDLGGLILGGLSKVTSVRSREFGAGRPDPHPTAPGPGAPPSETRTHEIDPQTYGARRHRRCGRGMRR